MVKALLSFGFACVGAALIFVAADVLIALRGADRVQSRHALNGTIASTGTTSAPVPTTTLPAPTPAPPPPQLRLPIDNGTFGPDPSRGFPCVQGTRSTWYSFRNTDPERGIRRYIPDNQVLPTHRLDGVYCFIAYDVRNVVFRLVFEECCVNFPAIHVPTQLIVGADAMFHEYLLRGITTTNQFPLWRDVILAETRPLQAQWRRALGDATVLANGSAPTPPDAAMLARMSAPNARIPSDVVRDSGNRSVRVLPPLTPIMHMLNVDLILMMPALAVAQFMNLASHLYGSGIFALGPTQVSVIANDPSWPSQERMPLSDYMMRYMPLNVVYLARNVSFYTQRLTFAPRGYLDCVEPCVFHFAWNWMVPEVVRRMRGAMALGRAGNWTAPPKVPTAPPGEEIEPGVVVRRPVDWSRERPWWDPKYDDLMRNPPENLIIMKSIEGAYSGRMYKADAGFDALLQRLGYVYLSDTSPYDVRMYLMNHAKRLITMWGGGASAQSHLWGGGVGPREPGPRFLDVILMVHPEYRWEFDGFYGEPMRTRGVRLRTRNITQRGVTVFIGPPNPANNISEAAQSFVYAWTKMVFADTLALVHEDHLRISDDEKARDWSPYCAWEPFEQVAGKKWMSQWVYKP
jgi:hypothetical protein